MAGCLKNIINNFQAKKIVYWLFILFLVFLFHSGHSFNGDDGLVLNGAWNLFNGRRLYLDFFEFIPPASFYLIFGLWKIFKVSYFSAAGLSNLIWFLGLVGLFRLSQLVYPQRLNYLLPPFAVLFSSWFWLINHNVYNIVCLIWSLYFLFLAARAKNNWAYFVSGILSGLSLLFLQQKALVFIAAVELLLLFKIIFKRQKPALAAGIIYNFGVIGPVLFLLFWPWEKIYFALVKFPWSSYLEVNRSPLILLGFFLSFTIFSAYILRRKLSQEVLFLLFLQALLLISCFPLPDAYHIFLASFPILILLPLLLKKISDQAGVARVACLSVVFILVIVFQTKSIFYLFQTWRPFSSGKNPGLTYIKNNCVSPYLYTGPFAPNIYFETRKLSVSPYSFLISGQQSPTQFRETLAAIIKYQPDCALLLYPPSLNRFRQPTENIIDNYIRAHYRLVEGGQGSYLYQLK